MLGHVDVGSDRSLRSMEHIVGSRAWKIKVETMKGKGKDFHSDKKEYFLWFRENYFNDKLETRGISTYINVFVYYQTIKTILTKPLNWEEYTRHTEEPHNFFMGAIPYTQTQS